MALNQTDRATGSQLWLHRHLWRHGRHDLPHTTVTTNLVYDLYDGEGHGQYREHRVSEIKESPVCAFMPSRLRMLPFLVMSILVATVMVFVILTWPSHRIARDSTVSTLTLLAAVSVVILMSVVFVALGYRMARPAPAISVLKEGVFDNASLLYHGIGLLRWSEIASITAVDFVTEPLFGIFHRRFLVIVPVNWGEYERELPLWIRVQRLALRWVIWSPPGICIPQFMLPTTADEVIAQIRAAYRSLGVYSPWNG